MSSIRAYKPTDKDRELKKTTWGKASREWSDLPKGVPGPNNYQPLQFTEASHLYSMPRAARTDEAKAYKASFAPGPGAYEVRRDDKQEGPAKSFLGGALDKKEKIDNGVPGPGNYNARPNFSIPGFRIVARQEKEDEHNDDQNLNSAVGPQKYNPFHPAHTTTYVAFGLGTRDGLK